MILIPGGCGYVGSLLIPELLALGKSVRVVDTLWFDYQPKAHPKLEVVKGDMRSCETRWLDGVETVIYLAGLSNDPTADFAPLLNAESNVQAPVGLAEMTAQTAAREKRTIRFIFASTCSVYYTETAETAIDIRGKSEEDPVAPTANYSKTKRLAEIELLKLAEKYQNFCPVMLRKGTLFGFAPRMRFDLVINAFALHAWKKRKLTVNGSGEAWRPLLHVRDAVDAYLYCLSVPVEKVRSQIFNVLRKNYRVLELAHWVAEILEKHRGVSVEVKRNRGAEGAERSYFVLADKIERELGFRAERGATKAVLEIWDALEAGTLGKDPEEDPRFFNIKWFKNKNIGD
jgi:nucleoside-diphosphate-sugar epimerase